MKPFGMRVSGVTRAVQQVAIAMSLIVAPTSVASAQGTDTNLFLNGFFPIGVFSQPDYSFGTWKARGINTILEVPQGHNAVDWDTAARANGLRVIRRPLDENNPAVDKGNTNLLAWSHYDEPDAAGRIFTWTPMFEATYAKWRAADSNRAIFINFAGPDLSYFCSHNDSYSTNYASYYPRLIATADWIANDLYPCAGWLNADHAPRRGDITLINDPIRILKTDPRLRTTKPQFCFIETSEIEYGNVPGARCPTPDEVRAEIWYAIICGVRGFFYFPAVVGVNGFQFDGTPASIVVEITSHNATITQLARVLQDTIDPTNISATVSAPLAAGWRKTSDASYFFVLNTRNTTIASTNVTFSGIGSAPQAVVLKESRSLPLVGGKLTDSFGPYAVHIYVVSNSNPNVTYTVSYDPNGATSGSAPASQIKTNGVPLTLAVNSGNLAKGGHTFAGWNTAANGTGTAYAAGASYTDDASATLYAKWLTNTPPTITAPPTNITVMAGQSATFSVTASGSAPLLYQWYTNDAAIIGSTGTNHTTAVTITNDSGRRFKVTVTNAYGAVTSSVATLTVNAVPTGGVSATGGTITNYVRNGTNFTVHIFTNSGMLTVNNGGLVEYLIVGGGGGGGSDQNTRNEAGGGGGGGFVTGTVVNLPSGSYPVTVGVGGKGATNGYKVANGDGGNSVFNGVTAYGGGAGGSGYATRSTEGAGSGGGCGGGGYGWACAGGIATNNGAQGYNGGAGDWTSGGGGGGAGAVGQTAPTGELGGNGGSGRASSISGALTNYAGGGGGGSWGTPGSGRDGGGNGYGGGGTGGWGAGGNGRDGTGGGGGGGVDGGNGGSGIVIVRYVTAVVPVAPTGLVATVVGKDRIELTWTDSAANETGYVVSRSLNSNNWVFVAMTAAGATNYADNGLVANTRYYHRVAASNTAGLSAYAYASATTWTLYEAWRRMYFTAVQLANAAVSGDSADPDHDGANNADEFAAGTNPTDSTSLLTMYTATNDLVADGKFLVCWQSVSGKTYTVMAATNLLNVFGNLATNISATPPVNAYTDTVIGAGQKFYRVKME